MTRPSAGSRDSFSSATAARTPSMVSMTFAPASRLAFITTALAPSLRMRARGSE